MRDAVADGLVYCLDRGHHDWQRVDATVPLYFMGGDILICRHCLTCNPTNVVAFRHSYSTDFYLQRIAPRRFTTHDLNLYDLQVER